MVGEPVAGQPAEVPVEPTAAQHVPGWACAACVKTSRAAASRMACFMRLWRLNEKIKDNVAITADAIYTDESNLYGTVAGCIKNHRHDTVCHIAKEWVRGDVHTGTIDGYWGLLKRGIIGSFHQVSIKHLHRYLSEFQFRWNNREAQSMFMLVVAALMIGTALPYTELIGKMDGSALEETQV